MLPKIILLDLDNVNKEFQPLINWDEICKCQENEGIGIRKAEDVNIALQLKFLWNITTKQDNIYVKFIKEKYVKE